MTDSPDAADGHTGLSRRQILKKSALIGGTALWVAPTVLTITAAVPPGSDPQRGDGSKLCADYYLLLFRCGGAYYLVKVTKDPSDSTKLKIIGRRDLFLEDDQWHAKPGNRNKQTDVGRLRKRYNISLDLPASVTYYTSTGGLCVDVGQVKVPDPIVPPPQPKHPRKHHHPSPTPTSTPTTTYHLENACAIVTWIVKREKFHGSQLTAPQLGPVAPHTDTPQVTCFACCRTRR